LSVGRTGESAQSAKNPQWRDATLGVCASDSKPLTDKDQRETLQSVTFVTGFGARMPRPRSGWPPCSNFSTSFGNRSLPEKKGAGAPTSMVFSNVGRRSPDRGNKGRSPSSWLSSDRVGVPDIPAMLTTRTTSTFL
jgi:hypothetical protein